MSRINMARLMREPEEQHFMNLKQFSRLWPGTVKPKMFGLRSLTIPDNRRIIFIGMRNELCTPEWISRFQDRGWYVEVRSE